MSLKDGFGAKLLAKMGWTEGTGLGAKRDGVLEPMSVSKRTNNLGVGAEHRPFKDAWWEKAMEDAYGKPQQEGTNALFDACEGRRCRPHGTAKLARIDKQDKERTKDGDNDETLTKEQRRERRRQRKLEKKLKAERKILKKASRAKKDKVGG